MIARFAPCDDTISYTSYFFQPFRQFGDPVALYIASVEICVCELHTIINVNCLKRFRFLPYNLFFSVTQIIDLLVESWFYPTKSTIYYSRLQELLISTPRGPNVTK